MSVLRQMDYLVIYACRENYEYFTLHYTYCNCTVWYFVVLYVIQR